MKTRDFNAENLMNAKDEIFRINQEIKLLELKKKELREKRKKSWEVSPKRGTLPSYAEVGKGSDQIFMPDPVGYTRYTEISSEDLAKCFVPESWRKIMNAVQRRLYCDGPDLCLIYRTKGTRQGNKIGLIAFKHRFNAGLNALMRQIRKEGRGTPFFSRSSGIWSIEDSQDILAILRSELHHYFRWLVDVRAALVLRATRESCYYRPNFTRHDHLPHHDILNSLCKYLWWKMPTSRGEIERGWLTRYFADSTSERKFLAEALIPGALRLAEGLRRGEIPSGGSTKEFLQTFYKELCAELGIAITT